MVRRVSLRVGRFAALTIHRTVIQYRSPPRARMGAPGGQQKTNLKYVDNCCNCTDHELFYASNVTCVS